jgi:hypothetical protein
VLLKGHFEDWALNSAAKAQAAEFSGFFCLRGRSHPFGVLASTFLCHDDDGVDIGPSPRPGNGYR